MGHYLSDLITKDLDGKYNELTKRFGFHSDVLGCAVWVPIEFVCDMESVPLFRTTNKRAGVIHDYLCRIDAVPTVTKSLAAKVYLEAMTTRDKLYYHKRPWYFRSWLFVYRHFKSRVVRIAWGYWKKHRVFDTLNQIKGK